MSLPYSKRSCSCWAAAAQGDGWSACLAPKLVARQEDAPQRGGSMISRAISRRNDRCSGQRSESACGPDRHGHGEQDYGDGAAHEADGASRKPDRFRRIAWATQLQFVLVGSDTNPPFHSYAAGCQTARDTGFLKLGDGGVQRAPVAWCIQDTCAKFTTTIIVDSLPPEVPGHGLVFFLFGTVEGVADALKLLNNKAELVGEQLKRVFKTRDVRGRIVAHAAHNTRRAA